MAPTERLTMAQALIRYLMVQNVERDGAVSAFFGPVMGIFGHGNVGGIGEALEANRQRVRFIPVRNEQAMVHAASAFAWTNRRLGALACTTSVGPGATNLVTGAAGATINRLPVLLLPGDVFAGRRVRPVLQQLEAIGGQGISVNETLRPVSRYWDRIERPEQLLAALPEALRVLTSPAETGAVTLALPQDVQAEAFDFPRAFLEPRTWHVPRAEPEPGLIDQLVRLIKAAKMPMIVAGGGVRYSAAESDLAELAASFTIPVVETQAGKGTLAWDDPLNLGPIGATGGLAANRYAAEADLVISVGTRLADFTTASWTAWQAQDVRFAAINVNELDAAKTGGTAIVADARQALRAIRHKLAAAGVRRDEELQRHIDGLRSEWNTAVEGELARTSRGSDAPTQAQVIELVNAATTEGQGEGTVVCAAGSMPGDLHKLWRARSSDDYHVEYGYSCMGYEIAGGLGVKMADPDRKVFVLVGDGSYLMMNSEIVTSIQEACPLTIVLVDSHGYRSIGSLATSMGARNNFNDLRMRDPENGQLDGPMMPIDYVAHAASMGAAAEPAETVAELKDALDRAGDADRTSVIVVNVDPDVRVPGYESWWDVPVAEVSASETVRAARDEYEKHLAAERWHG
jgi:3D-(3,5/4)-trihydroxycyclohexane-1,2-dione acylhydrolase (decyclizing)